MWNSPFRSQKHAGQFSSQFLLGVADIAEPMGLGERGTIQSRWMATGVGSLMQRSAVIACSVLEGVLWGQVDAVRRPMVESAICLIVEDCRTAVVQNVLGRLDHFEHRPLVRGPFGNAFDLLSIENRVNAMNEPICAN